MREKLRLMLKLKAFILLSVILLGGCFRNETPTIETNVPPPDERAAKLSRTKNAVATFFKPMRVQEGDWLETFQERGQTFEEYLMQNPTLPTAERRVIYIQPMGNFTATQRKILGLTADYMRAFYSLPVKLNAEKPLPTTSVPKDMIRVNAYKGQAQIKTDYFIKDVLPKMLPKDAAALICFTNYDLYPQDDWSFVFGQASLQNRIGVWSLWRMGEPDKNDREFRLALARTLKIAMHETGHIFSIYHCTKYECLMSGVNHLEESDRRPLDVCPECAAKIAWAFEYEPATRYRNLANFWKRQNWADEETTFRKKAEAIEKVSANQ